MNVHLPLLQAYPFERLRQLFSGITPDTHYTPISLGIGEPRHATPALIKQAYCTAIEGSGLAAYPATTGELGLREAIAKWLLKRYQLAVRASDQILPVNGSREALFAFAQTVIASTPGQAKPLVLCPNPFYQIYEGAALLAGAEPYYVASVPERNFAQDWASVPEAIWARTQLLFVCSPGNPAGAVMPLQEWKILFELSDRYGFVIASDECYSEIYFRDTAPLGGLEAAAQLGRRDFKNLVTFTSLSKRSNVPGMRSGFCAGDAALMAQFLRYRTYHGSAMSPVVQSASIAAWQDEQHVIENRALYREKFHAVTPVLAQVLDVRLPDAGFYLWAKVVGSDEDFARALYAAYNVTVLPGSYLARSAQGHNPGAGYVRMALVAKTAECLEAAHRIADFVRGRQEAHI
jgi:N-succinyldiaminopimelate aminotransferase